MCGFTTDFDWQSAGYSPDRVDALVWGISELLVEQMPSQGIFELMRAQAAALAAKNRAAMEAARPIPTYAPGSLEYAAQQRAKGM
jgi:hypothetical protein